MTGVNLNTKRNSSWSRTLLNATLICGGAVAILLPAWLPRQGPTPIERGTVELLQALLLAASAAVMLGAASHAGYNRPVCRVIAISLMAAFIAEIDDFISSISGLKFPGAWVIGAILLTALVIALRHRRVMMHFFGTLGYHAGSGFIGTALIIIYVFNKVIGSSKFWRASLGTSFSPEIPKICKSYLELLGCYLIFIGVLGLSITLARRKDPSI